jgi:hypothetical protein
MMVLDFSVSLRTDETILTHGGKQQHYNNMNGVRRIKGVHMKIHNRVWNYNKIDEGGDDDDDR